MLHLRYERSHQQGPSPSSFNNDSTSSLVIIFRRVQTAGSPGHTKASTTAIGVVRGPIKLMYELRPIKLLESELNGSHRNVRHYGECTSMWKTRSAKRSSVSARESVCSSSAKEVKDILHPTNGATIVVIAVISVM